MEAQTPAAITGNQASKTYCRVPCGCSSRATLLHQQRENKKRKKLQSWSGWPSLPAPGPKCKPRPSVWVLPNDAAPRTLGWLVDLSVFCDWQGQNVWRRAWRPSSMWTWTSKDAKNILEKIKLWPSATILQHSQNRRGWHAWHTSPQAMTPTFCLKCCQPPCKATTTLGVLCANRLPWPSLPKAPAHRGERNFGEMPEGLVCGLWPHDRHASTALSANDSTLLTPPKPPEGETNCCSSLPSLHPRSSPASGPPRQQYGAHRKRWCWPAQVNWDMGQVSSGAGRLILSSQAGQACGENGGNIWECSVVLDDAQFDLDSVLNLRRGQRELPHKKQHKSSTRSKASLGSSDQRELRLISFTPRRCSAPPPACRWAPPQRRASACYSAKPTRWKRQRKRVLGDQLLSNTFVWDTWCEKDGSWFSLQELSRHRVVHILWRGWWGLHRCATECCHRLQGPTVCQAPDSSLLKTLEPSEWRNPHCQTLPKTVIIETALQLLFILQGMQSYNCNSSTKTLCLPGASMGGPTPTPASPL